MGRKIPGKKHRKVIDPEQQRIKRAESLKNKINNPPAQPDEQEVPRSVLEIMELKKEAIPRLMKLKHKEIRARKKTRLKKQKAPLSVERFLDKEFLEGQIKNPGKVIPKLVQRPNETDIKFLYRVQSMTQKMIKETQFEDKYGVTIKKDEKTGKVIEVVKDKKKKGKDPKKTSKKKSLKEKRKERTLKKKLDAETVDFSDFKDHVEFGEVVDRPPVNLTTVKQSNKKNSTSERYKNLLLNKLVSNDAKEKSIDQKFQQEKQEIERLFIVNAYREKKKTMRLK